MAHAAFSEKLTQLLNLVQPHKFTVVGIAQNKRVVRRKLAIEISKIAKALRNVATDQGLPVLKTQLTIHRSHIQYGAGLRSLNEADFVLDTANEFSAQLEDYGVSSTRIVDAEALRDEFRELTIAPRSAIVSRKELTRSMNRLVNELDVLLTDKIDGLVSLMEKADLGFHGNYMDARIFIDYGSGRNHDDNDDLTQNGEYGSSE
ncbi:MAG: hypothetical protein QNK23_08515 [Crocinitomicaceae bacterium]|nr:hypothetical protein [Crocinitomicaceae bacterium]